MVLNLRKLRFTLQKKTLAFLGIVPLLLVTAWVPADCPACHGNGVVSMQGMSDVTLVGNPSVRKLFPWSIVCGSWLMYQMELVITLQNDGEQDGYGFVDLCMFDPISKYQSDSQRVAVYAAHGNVTQQVVVTALTIPREYSMSSLPVIMAEVAGDHQECIECSGTGKVVLNSWFFVKKRWGLHSTVTTAWMQPVEYSNFEELEGWDFVLWYDDEGNEIMIYVNLGDWYADHPP